MGQRRKKRKGKERMLGHPDSDAASPQDAVSANGNPPPGNIMAVSHTTPPPTGNGKTCHCKPDQTPRWKIILEMGAVLVGICAIFVYYAQLNIMQRQMVVSERSWIQVRTVDTIYRAEDVKGNILMHVVNSGNTPATDITVHGVVEAVKSDTGPSFFYKREHSKLDIPILFPKVEIPFENEIHELKGQGFEFGDEQRKELASGDRYLAIYGTVTYKDEFGSWWTTFCDWQGFVKTRSYIASPCTSYNRVGKQEKN
jgi:hypothetical protein